MSIELHCHTLFSVDASGTPEALVDAAAEADVTVLAVTEHNHLGSLERARERAARHGIAYYTGVELDAVWRGQGYHFLCYGFDAENVALRQLVERQQVLYAERFEKLLPYLEASDYPVSRQALQADLARRYPTHPSPILNEWYAQHALIEQGVFPDRATWREVTKQIKTKIRSEQGADAMGSFCDFEEARDAVHGAGGVLLLAHVGKHFTGDEREAESPLALIRELIQHGLDGFEVYHPSNYGRPYFDRLVSEAQRLGCAVSGGSDCHHAPGEGTGRLGSSPAPPAVIETIDAALAKRGGAAQRG